MLEINGKIGTLYLEDLNNRKEKDRIKMFDSNKKYIDYYSLIGDNEAHFAVQYGNIVQKLLLMSEIDELMNDLCVPDYDVSNDWRYMYKRLFDEEVEPSVDKEYLSMSKQQVEKNDRISKIGDIYIYVEW